MRESVRAIYHSMDVLHRMRAPYPAAYLVKRYTYRSWAIDLVTYDRELINWVAYLFGPGVDGQRLGPFSTVLSALTQAKTEVDTHIERVLTEPPPPKAKKKSRARRKYKAPT